MPFLTIFTAPKAFTNPHIHLIQVNALRSWQALSQDVQVVAVGEEVGLADVAHQLGIVHLPDVRRNAQGTPLISSIFDLARAYNGSPCLAYVNADVMLLPDVLSATQQALDQAQHFLLVGQRWDLDVRQELAFGPGWEEKLRLDLSQRGRLHPPGGSDYFVFPRQCFEQVPHFAVGRAGWDNWMIYYARRQGWAVADATEAITAVHQDHDYSHLPGGQPHYRLPETGENVRLAGGRRTIFRLEDANYRLQAGHLRPTPNRGRRLLRELEIKPLLRYGPSPLAELAFTLFHPFKAWGEWRGRIAYKLNHLRKAS